MFVLALCVCVCSGGCNGRAPAEPKQNLLTVLQGPTVSHPLQGALGLGQQAGTVPGRREQRHGQVAAGQQDGVSSFPLAHDALAF